MSTTTTSASRPRAYALALSGLASAACAAVALGVLGGWPYYTAPLPERAAMAVHRVLRPSGAVGEPFGVAGFVLMLVPIVYSIRKKLPALRNLGSMKTWLDVHIFCGIVGPVCVTFHTSFKFNGIVSVAYWSMIAVVLSGFAGRYLYVRIPRGLRGVELTHAELDARAETLSRQLMIAGFPPPLMERIEAFEHRVVGEAGHRGFVQLVAGEVAMHRDLRRLRLEIARSGVAPDLLHSAIDVVAERAALLRHAAFLQKTKSLFDLWHVFHMPLVYVMFAIVVLHVAFNLYMGYVPFTH